MFIVFEGIDGSGTETWSKFTVKYLEEKGKKTTWLEFPDYKSPWGKIIRNFLDNELDMNAEMQFLTYAADIFKDSDFIKKEMTKKFVITDRYILSTMAYQSARGFPEEKAISFFNLFDFPKPDFIILLITTTDESMKRKINEHGKLDRHEKDKELLEIVTENYLRYSKEKYFSKNWIIINTSGKIEETKPKVIKILNSILD